MPDRRCSIPDCDSPTKTSRQQWCLKHWTRWYRHGDPLAAKPWHRRGGPCSVAECPNPEYVQDLCEVHHARKLRTGTTDYVGYTRQARGPANAAWMGDEVTYEGAHHRVRAARGSARRQHCHDCGGPAAHWSYDHADPDERRSPGGAAYSPNVDHYVPRCVPCHKIHDLGVARRAARATGGGSS